MAASEAGGGLPVYCSGADTCKPGPKMLLLQLG